MVSTTRRQFVALAAGGIAAAGTLGAGRAAAAGKDRIRIGILALTSHSPSIIAEGKGYFGEQGLAVEFVQFQAAQPMAVGIASGDIDFGMTAISGGLVSLAEKGAVKVIGGALQETPGVEGQKILASKKAFDGGMSSPEKIKGHSFGVTTAGSSFHYMAHKIADKCGLPALVDPHRAPAEGAGRHRLAEVRADRRLVDRAEHRRCAVARRCGRRDRQDPGLHPELPGDDGLHLGQQRQVEGRTGEALPGRAVEGHRRLQFRAGRQDDGREGDGGNRRDDPRIRLFEHAAGKGRSAHPGRCHAHQSSMPG